METKVSGCNCGHSTKDRIAIYAICIVNLVYILPSVAMADMVKTFAPVPQATVMLTISLPCLTSLIGINLIPILQSRFSLKRITLAALWLALAAGVFSLVFHTSFPAILLMSALQGIAYGVFCTIYPLLAAASFPDYEEQAKIMAGCTAMIQIGRLTLLFFGGLLADIAWYCVFYMLALAGIALILVSTLLTDCGTVPRREKGAPNVFPKLLKSGSFLYLSVTAALYLVFYYTVMTYASLYVQGYGLGEASATGTVSAAASGIAVFSSLLSAGISRVTKRYTSALAFLGLGLGLLLPGLFKALPAIAIGMTVTSIAKSQQMPYIMRQISAIDDRTVRTAAMAFLQTLINFGYFLSPAITTGLGNLLGDGSPSAVYFGSGAAAAFIGILMLVIQSQRIRKSSPELRI